MDSGLKFGPDSPGQQIIGRFNIEDDPTARHAIEYTRMHTESIRIDVKIDARGTIDAEDIRLKIEKPDVIRRILRPLTPDVGRAKYSQRWRDCESGIEQPRSLKAADHVLVKEIERSWHPEGRRRGKAEYFGGDFADQ